MVKVVFGHYNELENLRGLTLMDMHSHTSLSDGHDDVLTCLKRAKKRELKLCITDHNEIHGSLLACKQGLSLPSIEVTSKDCYDFLLYFYKPNDLYTFYNKYIKGHRLVEDSLFNYYRLRWSTEELLAKAKEFNAVVGLAHPDAIPPKNSAVFIDGNKHLLKQIDVVEGINSTMSEDSNKKAIQYAQAWQKPLIASSDAHLSRFIGAGVTAFESNDVEGILEDMRKGRSIAIGKNLRLLYKLKSAMIVVKNNLRW